MAQRKQDHIGIALWISSDDLSPDAITQKVGLQPSYVQVRGTPIRGVARSYEHHSWKLGDRLYAERGDSLGNKSASFLNEFFGKIKSAIPKIKELSTSNEVSVALIYNLQDMPYIGLSREQIQLIAEMGASVSFDVMIDGSASESED